MEIRQLRISVTRLEAFSDAVIAIAITLMVLAIEVPSINMTDSSAVVWKKLSGMLLPAASYLMSFLTVGVLWVNHHHFMGQIKYVDRNLLWFNLHFLFWLSWIPIPTKLLGHIQRPEFTSLFGFIGFMSLSAFLLMRLYVQHANLFREDISPMYKSMARKKLRICTGLYFVSIFVGYISVYLSLSIFVFIAGWYFFPAKIEVK